MIINNISYELNNISLRQFLLFFIYNSIYIHNHYTNFSVIITYKNVKYSLDCTGFLYSKEELIIGKKLKFSNYKLSELYLSSYKPLYKEIIKLLNRTNDYK